VTSDNDDNGSQRRDKALFDSMTIEQKRDWARGIANRMKEAWGVKTHPELTKLIGCNDRMVGNWISSGSFPWEVVYFCHKETGSSLDWLYNALQPSFATALPIREELEAQVGDSLEVCQRVEFIEEKQSNGTKEAARIIAKEVLGFLDTKKA
jgi:hypothetical protein